MIANCDASQQPDKLPDLVTIDFIASEGIGGGVDEAGDSTNVFNSPFELRA